VTQATNALPDAAAITAAVGSTAAPGARGSSRPDLPAPGRRSPATILRSLFALTKPRIIELLLVTTLPTMLLARRGLPSAELMLVRFAGRPGRRAPGDCCSRPGATRTW